MKKSFLLILLATIYIGCNKNDDAHKLGDICKLKTELSAPPGYQLKTVGEIDFNGSVQSFQFVTEQVGYAMLSKNVGGFVEVFKTTNGGQTWSNLVVGINQFPRSMIFKDENYGIITTHDVSGCPPPNCQNKCVILVTVNGGENWQKIEIENLNGVLYHPQYDYEGNLYANLSLNSESILVKSPDNGMSWDTLFSSAELGFTLVTYSFEIFQDKIYISGRDGNIVVIDKNGQLLKSIKIDNSSIWDLQIIDENNLIAVLSGKVIKSTNGGNTWETIYDKSARMIGFDSADKGLMLLQRSHCPTDVIHVNDLFASTNNGGATWNEAQETTTNMQITFSNSQKMSNGNWHIMLGKKLIEIVEN